MLREGGNSWLGEALGDLGSISLGPLSKSLRPSRLESREISEKLREATGEVGAE